MAIEIRELVVKATVSKSQGAFNEQKFVTPNELRKSQDKLLDKIMSRVKSLLEENRSWR